jgi:hypothetical protein
MKAAVMIEQCNHGGSRPINIMVAVGSSTATDHADF